MTLSRNENDDQRERYGKDIDAGYVIATAFSFENNFSFSLCKSLLLCLSESLEDSLLKPHVK